MIKFSLDEEGKSKVGLGLSFRNLELLKRGKPITFNLTDMDLKDISAVLIFSGETDQTMFEMLKQWIGTETSIRNYEENNDSDH